MPSEKFFSIAHCRNLPPHSPILVGTQRTRRCVPVSIAHCQRFSPKTSRKRSCDAGSPCSWYAGRSSVLHCPLADFRHYWEYIEDPDRTQLPAAGDASISIGRITGIPRYDSRVGRSGPWWNLVPGFHCPLPKPRGDWYSK